MNKINELMNYFFDEKRKKMYFPIAGIVLILFLVGTLCKFHTTIQDAATQEKRVITTNTNEYKVQYIKDGDCVRQTFVMPAEEMSAIYLRMAVFDEGRGGGITVRLYSDELLIEEWNKALSEINSTKYKAFPLKNILKNTKDKKFTIELVTDGVNEDDELCYYYCTLPRGEDSECESELNGETLDHDIFYEVASAEHPYGFIEKYYIVCAVLSIIFLGLCFYLLWKRCKLEIVVCGTVFFLGLLYILVFPTYAAPDEPRHFATAYHVSNVLMFDKQDMEGALVYMRAGDVKNEFEMCPSIETYLNLYNSKNEKIGEEKQLFTVCDYLGMKNQYMYLPSALGITLGRLCKMNTVWTANLGKLFSLLFYCLMLYGAMHIAPFGKMVFAGISFFPMVMEQVTSYSYDVFVIGGYCLYIAFFLYLIYEEDKLSVRNILLLGAGTAILAPCKVIYVCSAGLVLLLLRKQNKRKIAIGTILVVFGAAIASNIWANWDSIRYILLPSQNVTIAEDEIEVSEEQEDEIGENSQKSVTYYSVNDFLNHPIKLVVMYKDTFKVWYKNYIYGIGGSALGWLEIPISIHIIRMIYIIIFLSIFIIDKKEYSIKISHRIMFMGIFITSVLLAMLSMLFGWTPNTSDIIEGVQGRYFLPLLPLAFLAFKINRIKLSETWARCFIMILGIANIVALTDVLSTILFR